MPIHGHYFHYERHRKISIGSGEIGHLSFGPVLSQWENFDTSTNETKTSCYFICITIKQLYLVSIFPLSAIYVPLPVTEKSAILTSKFQSSAHNS